MIISTEPSPNSLPSTGFPKYFLRMTGLNTCLLKQKPCTASCWIGSLFLRKTAGSTSRAACYHLYDRRDHGRHELRKQKAVQLLAELETKVGLIERKRQGLGKPNLIYVKNFISVDDPVERHFLKCQNDTSGSVERTTLEVSKGHGTNTDMNNTEYSDTDSIFPSGSDRKMDGKGHLSEIL